MKGMISRYPPGGAKMIVSGGPPGVSELGISAGFERDHGVTGPGPVGMPSVACS